MTITKSDFMRLWVKRNPDVPLNKVATRIYKEHPEIFRSYENAAGIYKGIKRSSMGFQTDISELDKHLAVYPTPTQETPAQNHAMTKDELRRQHDVKTIVMEALKDLPYRKEGVIYTEAEFIRLSGLSGKSGYRPVLESAATSEYRGKAGGKTYWAHPQTIRELKMEGVLL